MQPQLLRRRHQQGTRSRQSMKTACSTSSSPRRIRRRRKRATSRSSNKKGTLRRPFSFRFRGASAPLFCFVRVRSSGASVPFLFEVCASAERPVRYEIKTSLLRWGRGVRKAAQKAPLWGASLIGSSAFTRWLRVSLRALPSYSPRCSCEEDPWSKRNRWQRPSRDRACLPSPCRRASTAVMNFLICVLESGLDHLVLRCLLLGHEHALLCGFDIGHGKSRFRSFSIPAILA